MSGRTPRPVLIIQHFSAGHAGLFAEWLERRGLESEVICLGDGAAVPAPADLDRWAALCLMGGPQHVYEEQPWIRDELALLRAAVDADVPIVAHCLGAQLVSAACGCSVSRAAQAEVGWHPVHRSDQPLAEQWLGGLPQTLHVFQWHEDSFERPVDAIPLLSGEHCPEQAYVLGRTLAMQFHIEITSAMVQDWLRIGADRLPPPGPTVQSAAVIRAATTSRLPASARVAERLYDHWFGHWA
ncbi:MAG: type 1 glutamine amidotransferase [Gammaproteobacteria bacterium]|nr:type 1 glutamine amidotransferase [Gammaproteobacteria bacterium]